MLAEQIRSGLAETHHDGAVAIVGPAGDVVAWSGDIERPFFLRSAAKPFQALVAQESGAGLAARQLAMACASHRGFPVHVSMVDVMLGEFGLDESRLQCPPDWPASPIATFDLHHVGVTRKRRIWHNCSGKHAGFLRACVANGWPTATYLNGAHPLQERVEGVITELGDHPAGPVGVDGCGAPVHRTTVAAMARLYSRLANDPRLAEVLGAMHRYPGLVGCNGRGDSEIAIATNSAAKGGAAGCVGVAVDGRLGIAAKSWDGLASVANLAAASALVEVGALTATGRKALHEVLAPPTIGGGEVVGEMRSTLRLVWA